MFLFVLLGEKKGRGYRYYIKADRAWQRLNMILLLKIHPILDFGLPLLTSARTFPITLIILTLITKFPDLETYRFFLFGSQS